MTISKTLMLAGFTAMVLGSGSAMAQEGGLSVPAAGFYQAPATATMRAPTVPVQSGSSDIGAASSINPFNTTLQPQFDFSFGSSGG